MEYTFEIYKEEVLDEMIKLGATEEELKLLKETTIFNGMKKHRTPKDVAWGILQ